MLLWGGTCRPFAGSGRHSSGDTYVHVTTVSGDQTEGCRLSIILLKRALRDVVQDAVQ